MAEGGVALESWGAKGGGLDLLRGELGVMEFPEEAGEWAAA